MKNYLENYSYLSEDYALKKNKKYDYIEQSATVKNVVTIEKEDVMISVIIPVYNVEKYLPDCLNSVLVQSYKNLEIILVDDGSPDSCGEICENYAVKDNRIKVIHKENGGLSDARNLGIDIAKGEYITFIDSDDLVTVTYIENLYIALKAANANLAISWFSEFKDDDRIQLNATRLKIENIDILNSKQCFERLLCQNGVETSAWGKLYKIELFEQLRYPKGKIYEDIPVTYRVIEGAKKIAVIECKDYFYRQRNNSIQNQKFNVAKMAAIEHMNELMVFIQTKYPELDCLARCRMLSIACNLFFQIDFTENSHEYLELWKIIRDNRGYVLSNKHTRKKARIASLLSFLGPTLLKFVYLRIQTRR